MQLTFIFIGHSSSQNEKLLLRITVDHMHVATQLLENKNAVSDNCDYLGLKKRNCHWHMTSNFFSQLQVAFIEL